MSASRGGGAVCFFGAGVNALWCLDYLRRHGHDVTAFIDNDVKKQGTKIMGLPVISYAEYLERYNCPVFITAKHCVSDIEKQLEAVKIKMNFDAWEVVHDIEQYECVYDALDDESRDVLEGFVNSRLTGDARYIAQYVNMHQYFCLPNFYLAQSAETMVNAGCFVGDTIETFISVHKAGFNHIYGFDPGEEQLAAAKARINRLAKEWAFDAGKVTFELAGLGKSSTKTYAQKDDTLLSSIVITGDGGECALNIVSLDDYFMDTPISFLIADIEGSEVDMLSGAQNVIKRDKPKLALSAYHKCDDLIRMVHLLHELVPEYNFALRHHSSMQVDTVLYCWV